MVDYDSDNGLDNVNVVKICTGTGDSVNFSGFIEINNFVIQDPPQKFFEGIKTIQYLSPLSAAVFFFFVYH